MKNIERSSHMSHTSIHHFLSSKNIIKYYIIIIQRHGRNIAIIVINEDFFIFQILPTLSIQEKKDSI